MSKKHLRKEPHIVSSDCWWYEENAGIHIVIEHRSPTGAYLNSTHHKIPWRDLRGAIKRKDKKYTN